MFYVVKARPRTEQWSELEELIASSKIASMRPFGQALQHSLQNAKIDHEKPDYAIWVEEDYCSPPLAMERASVLDRYFSDITTKNVESEQEAWKSLSDMTSLWYKAKKK